MIKQIHFAKPIRTLLASIFFIVFIILFTACPDHNQNGDDDYDSRNITRNNDHVEYAPNIGLDSEGNVHIVYHGSVYENEREVWYIVQKSNKWTNPINLSNSTNHSRKPSICIDSNGKIHIIWQEDCSGNGRTKYVYKENNEAWIESYYITDIGNSLPQLATDSFDQLHILGMGNSAFGLYRRYRLDVWENIQEIYYNMNPTIVVTNSGDIHVSHNSNSLWYFNRVEGSSWSEQIKIDDSANNPRSPNITIDSIGNVYIAWATKYSDQVKFKIRDINNIWSVTDSIPDIVGDPWITKIEVDENGIYFVWNAYTESGDYDIYYKMRDTNSLWSETLNISNTSGASLDPSLTLRDNLLHITWVEKFGESLDSNADIYYSRLATF